MQRGVGGEELRRAAWMPFQSEAGRFDEVGIADVGDHLFVVTIAGAKKSIAEAARRFENGSIGGKARGREQCGFGAAARRVAGVKRFDHGALLAMNAACRGSGDAKRGFHFRGIQFQ
jgi:hypothetical protein